MPSMLMLQDSMFPRFTDEVSDSEKIDVMHDYLYQLLEQLRYTLSNLGAENFNDNSLAEIGDGITEEFDEQVQVIRQSLEGINGTLYGTATGDGILTRLENAEGSVATISTTAAELKTRLESAEGSVATISTTAAELKTRLTDAEGNISTFRQTANALTLRVEDAEAAVTEVTATVNGLTLSVSNKETSSVLKLMSGKTELVSKEIKFTGAVTFDDLSGKGTTVIDGSNISTGVIKAIGISACDIEGGNISGTTIIGSDIELDYSQYEDDANGILFKYTGLLCGYMKLIRVDGVPGLYFGTHNKDVKLKINSAAGMSLEAESHIYMYAPNYVTLDSDEVNIHNAIFYTSKGNSWEFRDDGIYFAGALEFAR